MDGKCEGDSDGDGEEEVLWGGKKWSRRFLFYKGHSWVAGYSLLKLINCDNRELSSQ